MLFSLSEQIFSMYQVKGQSENINIVYARSLEFLNNFYSENTEDTYKELETRYEITDDYVTEEQWDARIRNNINDQTLIEILKPKSSTEVSYILQSSAPKEIYVVKFLLLVDYMGKEKRITGEIQYRKTDEGFKIHKFEIDDVLDNTYRRILY